MNTANATLLYAIQHAVGIDSPLDLLEATHTARLALMPEIGASRAYEYHEPGQLRLAFELYDLLAAYKALWGMSYAQQLDFLVGEGLESVNEMIEHMYYQLGDD